MKKAFDQTFRDIKRGVNKNVLKVPGVERKVLDATSNETWGPHGSLLADLAQASRNFNDYQLMMTIIWKRINDTGKNWRHVYKGLTVLEYLVAYGSERVIEEIKEHSYQISTLSDFQYIDSSGRDQGSNVRKKSQSLVILVNDKERILEVRQKAASNRDKFGNTSSTGGMYKPSSYSSSGGFDDKYDDEGRYGSREDDRNGNGREDDRSGKFSEDSGRDGDRYGQDYEERYGKDDNYQGRGRSAEENHSQRSRSSDRDREQANDDDRNSSSRGSGARADEHSQDGRPLDRKLSEQNLGAPPSYEEAVNNSQSPVHSERGGESSTASAPKVASPPASSSSTQVTTEHVSFTSPPPTNEGVDTFDEFDPRGSFSAAPNPITSNSMEMDLLGSLLEPTPSNALALVSSTPETISSEADTFAYSGSGPAFSATGPEVNQTFEDPFGDTPFKATPSWESGIAAQVTEHPSHLQPQAPSFASEVDNSLNFNFADTLAGISYAPDPSFMSQETSASNQDFDILADILPPSGPSAATPSSLSNFTAQPLNPNVNESFYPDSGSLVPASYFNPQVPSGQTAPHNSGFPPQSEFAAPVATQMVPRASGGQTAPHNSGFPQQSEFAAPVATQMAPQVPNGTAAQYNGVGFFPPSGYNAPPVASYMGPQVVGPTAPNNVSNFLSHSTYSASASQAGFQTSVAPTPTNYLQTPVAPTPTNYLQTPVAPTPTNYMTSQPNNLASTGQLAIVHQPSKDKFETKSTVWADTLNRGLVNLNISGAKTNPLSDIGIDFDAINRKEKRMEKHVLTAAPVASTIHMGKAMGSGSGIGRAGAGALRPSSNPMMGMGMGMDGVPNPGMGMGGAPNPGMGMAPNAGMQGYGGMNQQMGMGGYGSMNPNQHPMGMGMGMNMGMGQGAPMQPQAGMLPGPTMQGGYNPMMGGGGAGYPSQQPYGGGYR